MPANSIPFGLGLAGIGAILIASGVTGNSLSQVLQGNFTRPATSGTSVTGTTGDNASSSSSVTGLNPNATSLASTGTAPTSVPKSPTMFSKGIPTYPSLANKSMSWLLANGYTKNANGQVVSTK